jgi:hypothetical protein
MLLTSCEVEDYNQPPKVQSSIHLTKHPIPEYLLGDWYTEDGRGLITIEPERIVVNIGATQRDINLKPYSVIVSKDCFIEVYLENEVLHIADWVWHDGTIGYRIGTTYYRLSKTNFS